ncbi:MAG TPA: cupin domain-containing protein [Thermodesulfobacteriota bacterium]|nr:cupin domain-containing protein [Thermodesulfobacteriota bacterium]
MKKFVVHSYEVSPYIPPAHSGTENRRLMGPGGFGSERVEVVLGDIQPGGQADPHSHPGVEQAFFVLEGKAEVEVDGERAVVGPNDFVFFPAGSTHRVTPLAGSKFRLLIVYNPPLEAAK